MRPDPVGHRAAAANIQQAPQRQNNPHANTTRRNYALAALGAVSAMAAAMAARNPVAIPNAFDMRPHIGCDNYQPQDYPSAKIDTSTSKLIKVLNGKDPHVNFLNAKDPSANYVLPDESDPSQMRKLFKDNPAAPGNAVVLGAFRSITNPSFYWNDDTIEGIVQIDGDPRAVVAAKFLREMLIHAPSRQAMVNVLNDVAMGQYPWKGADVAQSLDKHGICGCDQRILDLMESQVLPEIARERLEFSIHHGTTVSEFDGTALTDDAQFERMQNLARNGRFATVLTDLSSQKDVDALHRKVAKFGDGKDATVYDLSNVYLRGYTGKTSALCKMLHAISRRDPEGKGTLILTENSAITNDAEKSSIGLRAQMAPDPSKGEPLSQSPFSYFRLKANDFHNFGGALPSCMAWREGR